MKKTTNIIEQWIENNDLTHGNSEVWINGNEIDITVEAPNNWTNTFSVELDATLYEVETEYLRMVEDIDPYNYFEEMYENVKGTFGAKEFMVMLEEDYNHYQIVVDRINGSDEYVIKNLTFREMVENMESMDFNAYDILIRLEETFKGYTFSIDTEDGDKIMIESDGK